VKTYCVDANVLLRLATRTPEDLYARARNFVKRAEEEGARLLVHPLHVATAVYVLKGYYEYAPEAIEHVLGIVLRLKAVEVLGEELVFGALRMMAEKKVDFDDAFLALFGKEENATVLSFDRDFEKLGVPWQEP
jgi:predicted nucleic acid-binding protein